LPDIGFSFLAYTLCMGQGEIVPGNGFGLAVCPYSFAGSRGIGFCGDMWWGLVEDGKTNDKWPEPKIQQVENRCHRDHLRNNHQKFHYGLPSL
jgi:hypothetical protein